MADNQVTTDFIADTSSLDAAAATADAALRGYEKVATQVAAVVAKATESSLDAVTASMSRYADAVSHTTSFLQQFNATQQAGGQSKNIDLGTMAMYAYQDSVQIASSFLDQFNAAQSATAKTAAAIDTASGAMDQFAGATRQADSWLRKFNQTQSGVIAPTVSAPHPWSTLPVLPKLGSGPGGAMDKVDASTKRATASVAMFGDTARRASYQASAGFDNTAGRVTQLHRSITAMQKGLRLGGGLLAGIHAIGIGASLLRGDVEGAMEEIKSLPFGIGTAAQSLERVVGYATGFKQQTDAANQATEEGNRIIQERAELIGDIKRRAEEANKAIAGIEDRRGASMAVGDSAKEQVKLEQDQAREMLAITNALADAKKRAAELGLSTSGEVDAIVQQMNATRELHQMERRGLETSRRQRQEATAYDLDTRLAALNAVDEEERRIIEAKQARTNAVAEAEQAVLDIQLSNQRRGIKAVTAEEQRAQDIVTKTKAVQDAMVSAVEREVAERRKATEESRRQAEAVLDARLATEQMRARGMDAAADVYSQTQGTRDEIDKARREGDTGREEKLLQLLNAQLTQIVGAAQKQSDDAAQALQDMLASQQRIEAKSVDQAAAEFRMQEVTARERKQEIEKQVKATLAVEKRVVEVRDAVREIKTGGTYGP